MPVLDQDKKTRKLVWGMTALALVALVAVYWMTNEPHEVEGYSAAVSTPGDPAPVATPQ